MTKSNLSVKTTTADLIAQFKIPGFKVASSTIDRGISGIIYCDPGVGKSTAAATLPVGETIIINTEAGLGPYLGTNHVVFDLKTDLSQIDMLYKFLRTEKHPFKYVVLDNVSELQDWMVNQLVGMRGKDFATLSEYGDAAFKMVEYLHLFRDLVEKGICVVFNAWEEAIMLKNDSSGTVETKTAPKLFKSIVPKACGIVDFVGHLEKLDKTGDRWIRFEAKDRLIAKCQFSGLDACEPINKLGEGPGLKDVFDKLYAHNYKP